MTSLIDVIFLLLLFFMLSSTFSRFGQIELSLGGGSGPAEEQDRFVLLRLNQAGLSINGQVTGTEEARARIAALQGDAPAHLVLSVGQDAGAQALAETLLALRGLEQTKLTVVN